MANDCCHDYWIQWVGLGTRLRSRENGVSVQLRAIPRRGWQIISTVLKTPPADLTVLAKRNDGLFPIAAVNEIIDGRMLIAAHGNREMPIWGFDVMGRSRISVIVDYLNRIQEK